MRACAGAAAQSAARAGPRSPRPAARSVSASRSSCTPPQSCLYAAPRLPLRAAGAPSASSANARRRATRARAAPGTAGGPDERLPEDGGIAGFDPMEEVGVPRDQRPVNELAALRDTFLYDWAPLPLSGLLLRCGVLFAAVFVLLAAPISDGTFDPMQQPVQFALAACAGSLVVLGAVQLRIYLGWSYVGNRLLSAVIEYEETGWYDGQLFVKPPKVLARDRLLGNYEVKPVLAKLKGLLLASGLSLAASSVALSLLISTTTDSDGWYGRGAGVGAMRSEAPVYRSSGGTASNAEQSATDAMELLRYDDGAAAEEAAAIQATLGNVPAFCNDRYFSELGMTLN